MGQAVLTLDRAALVAAATSILLTLYLMNPFSGNAWSIIDDHEIIGWIGTANRVALSDYVAVLLNTEVGKPSETTRFRPVYYGLRVATAVLAGKNVSAWYTIHAILLASSFFLLLYAGLRFLARTTPEKILVLAMGLLVLSRTYWADIFARLGPAEAYAIFGFSIATLGFAGRWLGGEKRTAWYVAVAVGSVVASGSKENLVILSVPLLTLTVLDFRQANLLVRAVLLAALAAVFSEALFVWHLDVAL